jgi:membrane glycosyltransferase
MDKIMITRVAHLMTAVSPRDVGRSILPPEQPLAMPPQDFHNRNAWAAIRVPRGIWMSRAALFGATGLVTAGFASELYAVLSFVQMTPIQLLFLVLSTLAFGWIALGSLSAAMGFMPLFAGEKPDTLALPEAHGILAHRTALLFPVYHEDPIRIAGTIEAMARDLTSLGHAAAFDVFILSDSRTDVAGSTEEMVFAALADRLASAMHVFYRRRRDNAGKKAGNVKDWVERFGAGYATFVILDADSVMSGSTLTQLALAMQVHPRAGLIQTTPRLTGGTTVFQRLQQFSSGVYGPAVAAGLAVWHGHQSNYWGHNAIVRTVAFAAASGLPELPGKPPLGGPIQSHDFVEAVLLQRAGWEVHLVPTADGSFEGAPPGLLDLVVRDRRWAQGNLQHLSIVPARGLTAMGRLHLVMGAMAYVVSAVWAASLAVGVVLALQGQHVIPSYFLDAKTLFPIWPMIDPGAALRLFLATLGVVLMPKVVGLVLEIRRAGAADRSKAGWRAIAGVLIETAFSMLFAPVLMMTQTTATCQILAGRDSGWKAQRRSEGRISIAEALRFHFWHTLVGLTLAALCWLVSIDLMAWMAPVILGLILSAPLSWWTARPAGPLLGRLLATDEDRSPPLILKSARADAMQWAERAAEGVLGPSEDLSEAA